MDEYDETEEEIFSFIKYDETEEENNTLSLQSTPHC
jgi:hypothetical protein